VSALVQVSTGLGLVLGQGIAGFIGPHTGWRWPFVVVAVPAVLVAAIMVLTAEEPPRGMAEVAVREECAADAGFVYNEKLSWSKALKLFAIPTNVLLIIQGFFGCLPWGMLLTFFNDFLSQNKGLGVQAATMVRMTSWPLCCLPSPRPPCRCLRAARVRD
jgi:predicted MFS family arabinose efflux permease